MSRSCNSKDFSSNHGFWLLLKKSIMLHKDSTSLKEKILVAKRILTPIIQDLMTDALVQTEIEKLSKFEKNRKIDGKNIKILFNKVKSDETGCFEGTLSDNEWATKILMEINRDLEEPFDKGLVEKHRRPLDESVNETLLEKLISVYRHLGEIIDHLKNRIVIKNEQVCLRESKNRDVKLNTSALLVVSSEKGTDYMEDSVDTNAELEVPKCQCQQLPSNTFDDTIKHQVVNYQCSYKDLFELDSNHKSCDEQNMRRSVCSTNSIICLRRSEEGDGHVDNTDLKSIATSFSQRPLTERGLNHAEKKEIVNKCLEGLDKVRAYLESLRMEEECEEHQLSGGDKCKDCFKIRCECLVMKQQEDVGKIHDTNNYRAADVPSVHPSINKKGDDNHKNEDHFDNEAHRQIHPFPESRIPKPCHKKRGGDTTGKRSCNDMKVILRNGVDSQQKITNLVIFNPDDPCKSIIKMKDHENLTAGNAGVSKIMKSSEMKLRIDFSCQKSYCVNKESWRHPLWPRKTKLESTIQRNRYGQVLLVKILFLPERYMVQIVFSVNNLSGRVGISFRISRANIEHKNNPRVVICFKYQSVFDATKLPTEKNLIITIFILHQRCLDQSLYLRYASECSKLLTHKNYPLCIHSSIFSSSEKQISQYMKNLFLFTSLVKGNGTQDKIHRYHQKNDERLLETILEHSIVKFSQMRIGNQHYQTYFFSYSVRSGGEEELDSSHEIDDRCDSLSAYPIWRIKKSKYYNLPSKKAGLSLTEPTLTDVSSKGNKFEPVAKSHTLLPTTSRIVESLEQKLSENHNIRTDVKRKVSFRDDVDFDKRGRYHREGYERGLNSNKSKDSISSDSLDILKTDEELADLLMTDSLMMISNISLPEQTKNSNDSLRKQNWKNLDLTNSAEDILTKLTRSFDCKDDERGFKYETKSKRPNSKLFNGKQSLNGKKRALEKEEATIAEENANELSYQLHNSKECLDSKKLKREPSMIEKFINERHGFEQLEPMRNEIEQEEVDEIVPYYDYKARPIEDVYDEDGHRIGTFGRYLTSEVFDSNGNLRTNLYTKKGKRIKAIYNSEGKILNTRSSSKIKLEIPKSDKIKDSLSQFIQDNIEVPDGENRTANIVDRSCSQNYISEYKQKNETSPKLASAVFERVNENKKIAVGLDSEAPKILHGAETRKSEISISWLNELLIASKGFARKKTSIFRKKPKLRASDLKILYDVEGNVITQIYDCTGKLLAESSSGNTERLIPFLFDNSGVFIEGRYLSEHRELKFVFDRNKNVVRSISSTTLNELLGKVILNSNQDIVRAKIEAKKAGGGARLNLSRTNHAAVGEIIPKEVAQQAKYIRQLFDEKLKTAMHNTQKVPVETVNPEFALNLLPYLLNPEGGGSNQYYDSAGHTFGTIGDENVVKNMALSSTRLENKKCDVKPSSDKDLFTKIKNYSEVAGKIISLDKGFDKGKVSTHEVKTVKKVKRDINSNPQKLNSRKDKQDNIKIPSASEHSISKHRVTNKNAVEKPLKSSTSLSSKYKETAKINPQRQVQMRTRKCFFDANGSEIREVYKGKDVMKIKSGEADKLVPFIFDRSGCLCKNIVDKNGRQITKIYDSKGREIRRTTVKSITSDQVVDRIKKPEEKSKVANVYDKNGNSVRVISDKSGRQLILTKSLKMEDFLSFAFHDNGNRRRLYDKNGYEIGPLYDYKGNLLKYLPPVKGTMKKANECLEVFSKSGRKLNNLYDSEGTIVIALYNDNARLVCAIEKGQNNANILSKYLFDEYGRFLKGKYFDFRGSKIKRVYDSMDNIVHSIRVSRPQKPAHYERSNNVKDSKIIAGKNQNSASTINKNATHNFKQRHRSRSSRIGSKTSSSLANDTPRCNVDLKVRKSKLKRPISAYYLKEPRPEYNPPVRHSCSSSSVLIKPKTLDDEDERMLDRSDHSNEDLASYVLSGMLSVENSFRQIVEDRSPISLLEEEKKPQNLNDSNRNENSFNDVNGYVGVGKSNQKEITERRRRHSAKSKNRDDGLIENFTISESENGGRYFMKQRSSFDYFDCKAKIERERIRCAKINHRKRLPFLTNLRDKFLTVVFENLNPYLRYANACSKHPAKVNRAGVIFENIKTQDKSIEEILSKSGFHEIAGKTKNKLNFKLDKRRKIRKENRTRKTYDSCSRCRTSCELIDEAVENACNNCRSISTIYTNKKLLKKIQDNQRPAKVDSDLIYAVSKKSLPGDLVTPIGPVFTQMNFTYEGINFYTPEDFAIRAYSRKRTSQCICQQCQSTGKNTNFIGKLGDEFMTRLSKLTVPFDKLLTKNVSFKEEKDGTDSLEALINNAFLNRTDQNIGFPEQKSCSSSCIALDVDDTIPISRKMIQETLVACVHLNNSSEVVGKLSNMVLRHFTTSIMREIKQTFFSKLNALQYRNATSEDSSIFEPEIVKEDICIGTELKLEDSLIVKHNINQTEKNFVFKSCLHRRDKATSANNSSGFVKEIPSKFQCNNRKTFICKVPNTLPFSFTMKTTSDSKQLNKNKSKWGL